MLNYKRHTCIGNDKSDPRSLLPTENFWNASKTLRRFVKKLKAPLWFLGKRPVGCYMILNKKRAWKPLWRRFSATQKPGRKNASGKQKPLSSSTHMSWSLTSSKLSATKYVGWYSVIGYGVLPVTSGLNGLSAGLPDSEYWSSPIDDSSPAPYAFSSLSCRHSPNSTVNQ